MKNKILKDKPVKIAEGHACSSNILFGEIAGENGKLEKSLLRSIQIKRILCRASFRSTLRIPQGESFPRPG